MNHLAHLCRLCSLRLDPSTSEHIFAPGPTGDNRLHMMISHCLPVTVSEDDTYPKFVCRECVTQLRITYDLHNKCVNAGNVFQDSVAAAVNLNRAVVPYVKREVPDENLFAAGEYMTDITSETVNNILNDLKKEPIDVEADEPSRSQERETVGFGCELCSEVLGTKLDLENHTKNVHEKTTRQTAQEENPSPSVEPSTSSKPFDETLSSMGAMASLTDITLETVINITNHLKELSNVEPREDVDTKTSRGRKRKITGFGCKLCSEVLGTKLDLESHIKINHAKTTRQSSQKPKTSPYVGKTRVVASATVKKIVNNVKEGPNNVEPSEDVEDKANSGREKETVGFGCKLCSEVLGTKLALESHIKINHAKTTRQSTQKLKPSPSVGKTTSPKPLYGTLSLKTVRGDLTDVTSATVKKVINNLKKQSNGVEPSEDVEGKASRRRKRKTASFGCKLRSEALETKLDLENHTKDEHSKTTPVTLQKLKQSPWAIKTSSPKPWLCKICQKTYSHRRCLSAHMQKTHSDMPFQCNSCGRKLPTRESLIGHLRLHTGEKPHPCPTCLKRFRTVDVLTLHSKRYHSRSKKLYQCNDCSKIFQTKYCMTSHLRIHSTVKPVICNDCGKGLKTTSLLVLHKRRYHTGEKPYPCTVCKKQFRTNGELTVHKRTHTGEKPFRCNFCVKSFITKAHATLHMRYHTGERPFFCDECGKSFYCKSDVTKHSVTHTREKRFFCEVCGEGFSYKVGLATHKKLPCKQPR